MSNQKSTKPYQKSVKLLFKSVQIKPTRPHSNCLAEETRNFVSKKIIMPGLLGGSVG